MRQALIAVALGMAIGWLYEHREELRSIRGVKIIHEQQPHCEPRLTEDEWYFRLVSGGGDL